MAMDGQGTPTEPAESVASSDDFVDIPDWETELAALEERASEAALMAADFADAVEND